MVFSIRKGLVNEMHTSRSMAPLARVGIIGGGQLGRMMIYRAKKLGLEVSVLDASSAAPSAALADRFIAGSLYDRDAIRELAAGSDLVTYEIEHLDVGALDELEASGKPVFPAASVLRTIQDKFLQKRTFAEAGVPVPRFAPLDVGDDLDRARRDIRSFGLPCVQKARTGGYDGRGVAVMRSEDDLGAPIAGSTLLEELVEVESELAILIARGADGAVEVYPPVGMRFKAGANVLEWLEAPADVAQEVAARAREVAVRTVEVLGAVGIVAVELFVDRRGEILVNEVAPRPHNSGHFTIEACSTDQFEQHLRAVCGLPLGSPRQHTPAVMINLLGAAGYSGAPVVEGLDAVLRIEGASFHWYGKAETRPDRKMGHVTVLAPSLATARERARRVTELIRVIGEQKNG